MTAPDATITSGDFRLIAAAPRDRSAPTAVPPREDRALRRHQPLRSALDHEFRSSWFLALFQFSLHCKAIILCDAKSKASRRALDRPGGWADLFGADLESAGVSVGPLKLPGRDRGELRDVALALVAPCCGVDASLRCRLVARNEASGYATRASILVISVAAKTTAPTAIQSRIPAITRSCRRSIGGVSDTAPRPSRPRRLNAQGAPTKRGRRPGPRGAVGSYKYCA